MAAKDSNKVADVKRMMRDLAHAGFGVEVTQDDSNHYTVIAQKSDTFGDTVTFYASCYKGYTTNRWSCFYGHSVTNWNGERTTDGSGITRAQMLRAINRETMDLQAVIAFHQSLASEVSA